jgi:cobalamin biosynthesis protein CobD/CbiB
MDGSKLTGWIIMLLVAAVGAVFVWGVVEESYWALAVPVIVGVFAVLMLVFWIGWTMALTEIEAPITALEEEDKPQ